ncbi:MAG: hypothetical protein HRU09_14590 [Oligoflexales bacterium]|nr:hypothetical protein [Oligoflexales bacterium]
MSSLLKVCIFFFTILIAFDAKADTAKVRKIIKKKKLILINAGKDDGLKKGSKVCFYKKKKKVACGKVKRIKSTKALVKVKKPKKIKKGFAAKYKFKKKRKRNTDPIKIPNEKPEEESMPEDEYANSMYEFAFRALYLPYIAPLTPASYNLLSYDGAATPNPGETLWKSDGLYSEGKNSSIFLSGGAELDLRQLGLRFGLHYKQYQTYAAESDYDINQTNLYMFSTLSAEAMGGYIEYAFHMNSFSLGIGLDLDATIISLIANRLDDNEQQPEETIYELEGASNIVSLRLPIRWDPYFVPVGLSMGLNLMIPLAALGTELTVFQADEVNGGKVVSVEDDLVAALNFDKGTVALEFAVGVFVGF